MLTYVPPFPVSGQRRCLPHLHIPGVSHHPQRFYSTSTPRRALKLVVFCNAIGGVFVKETTGTNYDGYVAERVYQIRQRGAMKPAVAITGEEYMDAVRAAWAHFMAVPGFCHVSADCVLVHDKSTVHTCTHVVHGLMDIGLRSAVQPTRSPDLMPMDYGVFGFTKNQLARELPMHSKWEDRVSRYMELLSTTSPAATIQQYPLRLQACIAARGEHLECALATLKKQCSARGR